MSDRQAGPWTPIAKPVQSSSKTFDRFFVLSESGSRFSAVFSAPWSIYSKHSSSEEIYLDLGPNLSDWHSKTTEAAQNLYRAMLENVGVAGTLGTDNRPSSKQEILYGHIASLLARKIARATTQVDELGPSWRLDVKRFPSCMEICVPVPSDSRSSHELIIGDKISELIEYYAVCRRFTLGRSISINFQSLSVPEEKTRRERRALSHVIYRAIQIGLRPIVSRNKILILGSYLGRFREILLSLRLLQLPNLLEIRQVEQQPRVSRDHVVLNTSVSPEEFARTLLSVVRPAKLSENFSHTLRDAYRAGFPTSPSVVFTSSSFTFDDEFKAYTAASIDRAIYLVGQHGNNYGVSRTHDICVEKNTSDLFLTWGWHDSSGRTLPVGQIKPKIVRKHRSYFPRAIAVLVRSDFRYFTQADIATLNARYWEGMKRFVLGVAKTGLRVEIQLHTSVTSRERQAITSLFERYPNIIILRKNQSLRSLVGKRRMVVFTYDSTGMLELANAKVPFFAYLTEGLGLIRAEFLRHYSAMEQAGLASVDSPEHAAARALDLYQKFSTPTANMTCSLEEFSEALARNPGKLLTRLSRIIGSKEPRSKDDLKSGLIK